MLSVSGLTTPAPQRRRFHFSDLMEYFSSRLTLDVVSVLREVRLAAHSDYMAKTKAEKGTEWMVKDMVRGCIASGFRVEHVPMDVWLSVALDMNNPQATELVNFVNRSLPTSRGH